jgi:hypothetical protein
MWLTGRMSDHKTIVDFRKDSGTAFVGCTPGSSCFAAVWIYSPGYSVVIDGGKLKAVTRTLHGAKMERRLAQIEERRAHLQQLDRADRQEPSDAREPKTTPLTEKIARCSLRSSRSRP